MLSTTSPTPTTATQTTGVMQSSISVTQQPLPVFRQPPRVHLPHYPPNYIPYGPYFSPFYVPPPPAIHQFLSNETFPQQPQQGGGGMYPASPPPVATTSNSKYPLPQYKPGSNTGNIGMVGSYGPYASAAPAGYNQDFLKYNESSLMKLPCKIFDPIPLGEAVVVGRMKDADSVAMPEGSSLSDLVQTRITTTHASVGVVVRLREELSLVKDKPAHFAIDQVS
ncbi:unnamed protein product [Lactuca saligna]|uniref:Uncharacterized protein n=1 Tax=Lactuca saligna TaxID=75948 RepID=A0AA35ZJW8_LACSI|nr:unnamed protein product [Lactuca saligna]